EIDQRIQALNDEHQSLDRQYQALLKPDVKCDRQAPRLDALKQRLTVSRDQTETQLQQLQLLINRVAQDKPTGIVLPGTKADYQAAVQRLNGFQGSLTQCKANFQALLDLVTTAHGKANGEWQKAQTALKNQLKIANDLVDRAVTLSQKPDKSLSDNTELAKLCGGMQDCMTELNRLSPLVSPDAFDDEWKNSYHYLIRSMLTSFGNIGRLFGDVETDVREHVGKLLEGGEGEVKLQAEAVDKLKPSPRTDLLTDLTHRRKAIEQTRQKLVEVEREVKAFPRLDEGQFPERLAAALKRLKELEDRLAEIETESVALARKEFQERLTPLLETARKLNTELEELRQNEERITLEGVDAIRQRVILCRQQFEGLREDQTVQKPDDLLAEIEQTWDQLVGHGKTMNGLEAVVYRRNRQQLEVDARKLLDEAKDIGRTVEREVRVDGRDMKYDRLQALHERVSVCTGALRHQRFDELFKEDPRPRQEAKETLDTAYTTISTAKKALAKIEEYNEVNRLSQSQIEERRAPVLEKVARIKRLADGINEDGSNAHHTTISRLRDRVADAQDELTQLQLSEKHRSKTRVPEALQLLDSLYTKLGTAMRNSQELQKRGQGPALSTASQIQYQWGIEYHTLFDDVWLKNNSPFPLNNVRLTVTVNEEGKAKMETLKHRRINSGERYKWTNVFSINEENVRDKRVVLSCDEDLLG
ncbi:MAG: hypothetical protein JNM56_26075, partial [Planctomycetia bacterium]|nr:hypothetical protein [Planctomycetia bacterium]